MSQEHDLSKLRVGSANADSKIEKTFVINDGEYFIYVESDEEGYDYIIYRADYMEYCRGRINEPGTDVSSAVIKIISEISGISGGLSYGSLYCR